MIIERSDWMKEINVIDKNNNVIASISDENIIVHNDYEVVETNGEARFRGKDGYIKLIKPEISI